MKTLQKKTEVKEKYCKLCERMGVSFKVEDCKYHAEFRKKYGNK